jgi:hypothetical protein
MDERLASSISDALSTNSRFMNRGRRLALTNALAKKSVQFPERGGSGSIPDVELTEQIQKQFAAAFAEDSKTIELFIYRAKQDGEAVLCLVLENRDQKLLLSPNDAAFRFLSINGQPAKFRIDVGDAIERSDLQKELTFADVELQPTTWPHAVTTWIAQAAESKTLVGEFLDSDDARRMTAQIVYVYPVQKKAKEEEEPAPPSPSLERKRTPVVPPSMAPRQPLRFIDDPMDTTARRVNITLVDLFATQQQQQQPEKTKRKSKPKKSVSIVQMSLSESEASQLASLRTLLCLSRTESRTLLASLLVVLRLPVNLRDAVFSDQLKTAYTAEVKASVVEFTSKNAMSTAEAVLVARLLAAIANGTKQLKTSQDIGEVLIQTTKPERLISTIALLDRDWKKRLNATYSQEDPLIQLRETLLKDNKEQTERWLRCVARSIVQNVSIV